MNDEEFRIQFFVSVPRAAVHIDEKGGVWILKAFFRRKTERKKEENTPKRRYRKIDDETLRKIRDIYETEPQATYEYLAEKLNVSASTLRHRRDVRVIVEKCHEDNFKAAEIMYGTEDRVEDRGKYAPEQDGWRN